MPEVARICCLSHESLASLTFHRTSKQIGVVIECEQKLAADARGIGDDLHSVIGSVGSVDVRRALVQLRRDLHNLRRVDVRTVGPWPTSSLPDELASRLSDWIAERERLAEAESDVDAILAEELPEKAGSLLRLAREPAFRRALTTASPAVLAELDRWAATPDRLPKRQKLTRIATYVVRACLKTSPFSFFTASTPVEWTTSGPGVALDIGRRTSGVLEVDAEYLDRWTRFFGEHRDVRPVLLLRVNPTLCRTGATMEFVGRPPREPLVRVPASEALDRALHVINRHEKSAVPEVEHLLSEAVGASIDEARRYLARLVEIGLVEVRLPVDESAVDWLMACGTLTGSLPSSVLAEVGPRLKAAGSALARQIDTADIEGQHARCATVRDELQRAAEIAGDPSLSVASPALFENALSSTPTMLNRRHWQPVIDDLHDMLPWFGLLDPHTSRRLAVASLHAQQFGVGSSVPLLALYRTVCERAVPAGVLLTAADRAVHDLFQTHDRSGGPREPADLADSELPVLRELAALRRRVRDVFDDSDGSAPVQPGDLASWAKDWPRWLAPPESVDFYLQLTGSAGGPLAVLNGAHSGHGRATARLRRISTRPEMFGLPEAAGDAPDEPVVAELAGRHGSTLNARAATLDAEITYPFAGDRTPRLDRLRPSDLMAVHDPRRGVVHLHDADGRRVIPAHLGLMVGELLPPTARFLVQVFGRDWLHHPSALTFVPRHLLDEQRPVVSYPRTTVGSVVLRRAGWLVARGQIPRRAASESDATYWTRLRRWSHRHRLPSRTFVRSWRDLPRRAPTRAELRSRSAKPVPLDLENWFTVAAFERLTDDADMVVFEEELPTAGDGAAAGDERFAVEVVLEVAGRARADG